MSYSDRRAPGPLALVLALLLLAPPAWNVCRRELRHVILPPEQAPTGAAGAASRSELEAARIDRGRLAAELAQARQQLRLLGAAPAASVAATPGTVGPFDGSRYRRRLVRILPLHDPSPSRDALWAVWDGDRPPASGAVLVSGTSLVGCIDGGLPAVHAARVKTVRDPELRVRFSSGEVWGFLRGTGKSDRDGRPLLEVFLLGVEQPLAEGQLLFTDGNDGAFPAGILIGEVVDPAHRGGTGGNLVRAAVRPELLGEGILLEDRMLDAARRAVEEAGS